MPNDDEHRIPLLGNARRPEDFTPGQLFEWIDQAKSEAILYLEPPTGYQLVDKMIDRQFGPLRDSTGSTIDSQITFDEQLVLQATGIESMLHQDPLTHDIRVIVTNSRGFTAHSYQEDEQNVIVFTGQTIPALARPFKYWLILMAPPQLVYLEGAKLLFAKHTPLSRSICTAIDQFFGSFAEGLPHSPRVRIGPTGMGLMEFVVTACQKFLALHEKYHLLNAKEQWSSKYEEEIAADADALKNLARRDAGNYDDLIQHFKLETDGGVKGALAAEIPASLYSKLAVPPITIRAPWEAGILAYTRIIHELCRTGGAEISEACRYQIRDAAFAVYGNSDEMDGLWEDLNDPSTLPGFFFLRGWKHFLDEPDIGRLRAAGNAKSLFQLLRLGWDVRQGKKTT